MCWATFAAILGCLWSMGRGLDTPARVQAAVSLGRRLGRGSQWSVLSRGETGQIRWAEMTTFCCSEDCSQLWLEITCPTLQDHPGNGVAVALLARELAETVFQPYQTSRAVRKPTELRHRHKRG